MRRPLLQISNLNKHFDGVRALDDFGCEVNKGEILGLIGPNGAGKTTLFNVMSGFIKQDSGSIVFKGKDISSAPPHRIVKSGISRTFQDLRLIRKITVLENVLLAFQNQPGEWLPNLFNPLSGVDSEEKKNRERAMELLKSTGLEAKADDLANDLSYGQQKLLSITCCLASEADLILLDEPVAGIAPTLIEQILQIIRTLPEQGKSVMIIEHNIDAIMQVCDRVVFMDAGKKITEGRPQVVRDNPSVIEAYLG